MITSVADLVAFLKRFHRHWLDDPTLTPALIPADLPPPLATIYRELGALVEIEPGPDNGWLAPFNSQDSLTPLSQLKRIEGMIDFACENQGNWSARCAVDQPDPPVYSDSADSWDTEQPGFVVVCDSLAHFLTTLCLQEAVMGCRNLASLDTDRPPSEVLPLPLEPLWLDGYSVYREPDHQFFISSDRNVLVMDWAGVWVGSLFCQATELVAPGIKVQILH